ncbi:MAG: glycoside hydrolase domain-containing protein [Verrucomicrobiota bacterium]
MKHNRMNRIAALIVGLVAVKIIIAPCCAQYIRPEENVILDADAFWRVRTIWQTEEVVFPDGKILSAGISGSGSDYSWTNSATGKEYTFSAGKVRNIILPKDNAQNWMALDFNDSVWARKRGPFFCSTANHNWKLIQLRGLFTVEDTRRAGDLKLDMSFFGGAVVYLNGEEVTRSYMPAGTVSNTTPALPYPQDIYFDSKGRAVRRSSYRQPEEVLKLQERRVRKIEELEISRSRLKKGLNVLAVAIHRAPTDYSFYVDDPSPHKDTLWGKIGLCKLQLIAAPGSAVVPNTGPARNRVKKGEVQFETGPLKDLGFHLRNQSVIQRVRLSDYPDAYAKVQPVSVTGVRNGNFAGQFLVGNGLYEISNLKVEVSDLEGPGTIPASAVKIRYGILDGSAKAKRNRWFDSLDDAPPRYIPMYKEHGAALQPVWLSVKIPEDAKPGDYTATITVSADREKTLTLPLNVTVIDWVMPDPADYNVALDLIQSPESVAMQYDVPFWSDEHFALLDHTFGHLSKLGDKTLYVTAVRRTHFGNEHAMVRWVRDDEFELQPDLSIVEKYIDTALKRMGSINGIILYAWEPPYSQGHAGGTGRAGRVHDRPMLYTLYDPETGENQAARGPAWGTDESREFWKKLNVAMKAMLKKRGLEDSLLFGLAGDHRPTKQAMDDMKTGLQDPEWAVHSHYYCDKWKGYSMGLTVALWGVKYSPADPSKGLGFGWSNPHWVCYYPRGMSISRSTPVEYRTKLEKRVGAIRGRKPIQTKSGIKGLGRLGADFWSVLKDSRGRPRGSLAGRYPETAWGQLNLNFGMARILGPGKSRPVPTIRSEALREAVQEVEARIYIEKALLDANGPQLLGKDLMERCRSALNERIRIFLHAEGEGEAWFISSNWRERAERLFALAAEVSGKYGNKEPVPDLSGGAKE